MNKSQKRTLQKHNPELIHDLELSADLVAKFIHHGLFNEDMIEDIKSERTRKDKVQKLLSYLPRRGPRAFDMFVHTIQDMYPWLAELLRKTHHQISLKTEPEMMSLKEKVDIYVHEHFGNSRRLCEEDKKEIRKFLYKHLKSHAEEHNVNLNERRISIQSDISDDLQALQDSHNNQTKPNEKDIENQILQQVYSLLNGVRPDERFEDLDCVDGPCNITLETIEKKVNQMHTEVKDLKNEIADCFSVLGLKDCEYTLYEVLETYKEKTDCELKEMRDRVESLDRRRRKLEEKLKAKEKELHNRINELATSEHENEKSKVLLNELKSKCEKLEQIQETHLETQKTYLKRIVHDLKPIQRQSRETFRMQNGYDEVDCNIVPLPNLSQSRVSRAQRQERQSRKSAHRERSSSNHHSLPKLQNQNSSSPWKY